MPPASELSMVTNPCLPFNAPAKSPRSGNPTCPQIGIPGLFRRVDAPLPNQMPSRPVSGIMPSMRWITFFLLLYLMTALQWSHLGAIPVRGNDWPMIDFLPMLAVFYALFATDSAAPLAALLCGLAFDIGNEDYIGTNMIPLALIAWLIVRIRLSIFREHFISQLVMTLIALLAYGLLSTTFRKLIGAPLEGGPFSGRSINGNAFWTHLGHLAGNAVYTAIVAPVVFWLLFRIRHLLGFTSHGPRVRGHT